MNSPDTAFSTAPFGANALPLPPPAPRRRWRRAVAWLAGWTPILMGLALLPVLGVAVLGYAYLTWSNERELNALIAEMDATDPHWRFDALQAERPVLANEQNPAVEVEAIELALRGAGGYDVGTQNWSLFEQMTAVNRLSAPQRQALRTALVKHSEAVQRARELKRFPGEGRFPIKYSPDVISTDFSVLQRCRNVMNLLQHDAWLRADDEDGAGAVQTCQALLVTARSIGQEPNLIAALIRYAGIAISHGALERTLAQTEAPEADLQAMQALLEREIESPMLWTAIRGERGSLDGLMKAVNSGQVNLSKVFGPTPASSWEAWLLDHFPMLVSRGQADYLRIMNKAVAAAKLPPEEQLERFREVENETRNSRSLTMMLMPAVSKVSQAHCRTQAYLRSAMVGLAVERYRLRHARWPERLEDLVAEGMLKAVPTDPFDGQPLRYRLRPDGAVVYSVGYDREDNGGTLDRSRPMSPGVDLGFELWSVRARRQPPLPVPNLP